MINLTRRNLGLYTGVALSALIAGAAKADTPFTQFAFPATGGSASRTEPDRWADRHNVKDFGAIGDGSHDDTLNIQAAINWTVVSNQRGTIYFPIGQYKITAALNLYFGTGANQSINLEGEGLGSLIFGTVNGYLVDRYDPSWLTESGIIIIKKLFFQNGDLTPATGAIRLGNTNGASIRDCRISGMNGVMLSQAEQDPTHLSKNTSIINCVFSSPGTRAANSNAVVTGNGTTIINMDCLNWDCAVRLCGSGVNIVAGRFEENNYGHIYGVDHLGNAVPALNCAAGGFSMESNRITSVDIINATGCVIYESGVAVYNGTPSYGLRLRSGVNNIVLLGCTFAAGLSAPWTVAAISIEDGSGTPGKENTFIGCAASNTGTIWSMPTLAKTAKFSNSNNPAAIFLFANLPGSSDRVFGDEYLISNSNVAVSAANFGATVTGGGAITAKVRWNGSNWIIV